MNKITKLAAVVLFSFFMVFLNARAEEIKFEKGTFNEVLSKAKTEKKILMIDFFTDWCKWCVELDKKVYTDNDVAEFANKKQVNWKIDAEKGEGIELAKKYAVSGYPTIVFVDGNGDEVDRIVGYIPAKDFLKKITEFSEGKNTYGTMKRILKDNPNDVKANYFMGERAVNNENDFKKAGEYFRKVLDIDKKNEYGYKEGALLYIAIGSGSIENIKKFIEDYPNSEKCKAAYIFLAEKCYQDELKFQEALGYYNKAFALFSREDEELKQSYAGYLITYMNDLSKKDKEEDWKKGLELGTECMDYVKGSVNEGSVYFIEAVLYNNLKDKDNANICIDKAIQIRDAKAYRELKEKINKQ